MGIRITGNNILENNASRYSQEVNESMERLSSGVRFTKNNPLPAERALSDSLSSKVRELNVYKRNAADGLSLTEFGDSNLSEISNINIRMRELVTQSTSPAISDKERQYLFIEYQSLYEEMDRVASSVNFNGRFLLNGEEASTDQVGFRIGPPVTQGSEDLNVIRLENLNTVEARPRDLGLRPAASLLDDENGVTVDDVLDNFDASDPDELDHSFDVAADKISSYRALFGATTTRLNHALQVIDIAYENMSSANSRLRDTDYATEITNMTRANMLLQATTSLLSQRQQQQSQAVLSLIHGVDKLF